MNQVLILHGASLHTTLHKRGNWNNGMDYFPLSSPQSWFTYFLLPSICPPEGCTPRMLFCGWWWPATQHVWKTLDASANSFMLPAYSISCSDRICVLMMRKILWKINLHTVEDLHMRYVNFIKIEIIVSEKENRHYLCTAACTLSESTRTLSRWRVIPCTLMSVVIRIKLSGCNLHFSPFLHAMR
jgi:hypothetical protein